ncbi:MAG: Ig-like domain-containing protein [bacterium]
MRKMLLVALLLGLTVSLITGCSQTATPELISQLQNSTTPQPEGLTIRGTVYALNQSAVVGDPLAGVSLLLSGKTTAETTTSYEAVSDVNGCYMFTNLPEGAYRIVATKEGYQRMVSAADIVLGGFTLVPSTDNTNVVQNINMTNTPLVVSISPAPGTTVEAAALTLTVVFNEAIERSSVRPRFTAQGIRTYSVADTGELTTSWSADSKTLTLTTGVLLANQAYSLNLDPGTVAQDLEGNLLDATGGSGGLATAIYTGANATDDYRVTSGGVPGVPTNLQITVNDADPSQTAPSLQYTDADAGTEDVDVSWWAPISGQVTGYKVYVSTASTGPWALLGTSSDTDLLGSDVDDVNTALYNGTIAAGTVDPVANRRGAFISNSVHFKVVAFNGDGEGTALTTSARDNTGPTIDGTADYGATELTNGYRLPAVADNTIAYVAFNEPVNVTSAGTLANYSLSTGTITSVTVLTSNRDDLGGAFGTAFTVVKIDADTSLAAASGVTLTVGTGVTDLSGNPVVAATGDTITF